MMWLGEKLVKGSPYIEAAWLWPKAANPKGGFPQHVHEHDESLGFFGSDLKNDLDLGGEVEFWIEDEKYLLTKSCIICIPQGVKRCPLFIRSLDNPLFHLGWTPAAPR